MYNIKLEQSINNKYDIANYTSRLSSKKWKKAQKILLEKLEKQDFRLV